jgi:hypothetical protein
MIVAATDTAQRALKVADHAFLCRSVERRLYQACADFMVISTALPILVADPPCFLASPVAPAHVKSYYIKPRDAAIAGGTRRSARRGRYRPRPA